MRAAEKPSVARELARKNVLLNAICPGPTNTPMMASVLGEGEQAVKWKDAMLARIDLAWRHYVHEARRHRDGEFPAVSPSH